MKYNNVTLQMPQTPERLFDLFSACKEADNLSCRPRYIQENKFPMFSPNIQIPELKQ